MNDYTIKNRFDELLKKIISIKMLIFIIILALFLWDGISETGFITLTIIIFGFREASKYIHSKFNGIIK